MSIQHLQVFTDASVNTKLKVGYGAYLVVTERSALVDILTNDVNIKRFTQTSSTKLELQTLLWALQDITTISDDKNISLTIYTDCQNIIGLPDRQVRLEQNRYMTSKNKLHSNYQLYQEFYHLTASIKCQFVKVVGHQATSSKDVIDKVFSLVDKKARQALRQEFSTNI
ncbi:ribonuclease HI [Paraglaciecola sp. L3A3]|uniref:ribonuclease HI n=1 Tax=Paraglaciecola sp. L3A3 TaxID=2686358 RepID=UPI001E30DDD0|nr:RNase H family protein [Paraglaciecola sp. L3A3]